MPLLGLLITSLLGGLASFFAQFVTRKVAIAAAAVTALGVIIGGALTTMNALITPMLQNLFVTQYGTVLGLAFPPCAGNCMATLGLAWAACALYKWQIRALAITVQA